MRSGLCAIALAIPVAVFTQAPADSVSPREHWYVYLARSGFIPGVGGDRSADWQRHQRLAHRAVGILG